MTAFVAGCFEADMLRDILRLVFVTFGPVLVPSRTCRSPELENCNGVAESCPIAILHIDGDPAETESGQP
ncbi:hypothetical protein N7465_001256 [Penicillium sp. CMV-2018d]|nr:hypothetical protein N7465_001256 [Penicillium sp. CMV-2018d]